MSSYGLPAKTRSPLREPHHFLSKSPLEKQFQTFVSTENLKIQDRVSPRRRSSKPNRPHKRSYYEELPSKVKSAVADLMLTVAEEEQKIEMKRQALAKLPGFEPYSAFSRLDRLTNGFLTGREIQVFLREHGYDHLLEAECQYIVQYFDSNPEEH